MGFLEIIAGAFVITIPVLVVADAVDERRTLDE